MMQRTAKELKVLGRFKNRLTAAAPVCVMNRILKFILTRICMECNLGFTEIQCSDCSSSQFPFCKGFFGKVNDIFYNLVIE
jgi:hypothetical protein